MVRLLGCLSLLACASDARDSSAADSVQKKRVRMLPCEISEILEDKCWACHGKPTRETAPMSLTNWEELHAPALERVGRPAAVYERVALRVHDEARPMPPRDRPQLTASEIEQLDAWLQLGAPPGKACPRESKPPPPAAEASDAAPEQPTADAGRQPSVAKPAERSPVRDSGADEQDAGEPEAPDTSPEVEEKPATQQPPAALEDMPAEPDAAECTYIELRARADESGTPFEVPADSLDLYKCFVFDLAFGAPTQALAIYPIFDNPQVLHHWLMYFYPGEPVQARGTTIDCNVFPPQAALVAGGAPGSGPWFLPKHVGLDLGPGRFILEMHYNNIGKPATPDRSGARLCTTQALRPETAMLSWLGSQLFSIPPGADDHPVAGRCKPAAKAPIHLLTIWPHMHSLGRRMSVRLDRADGTSKTVFDMPFSAESQRQYPFPMLLQPGDSLLTTCYFDNPNPYAVTIGDRVSDEMCNNFIVAYPAGALTSNFPSVVPNTCLGLP